MHQWFEQALHAQPVPWRLFRGTEDARLFDAVSAMQNLFVGSHWLEHVRGVGS